MSKRIYVGGLPFKTTEEELNALFTTHGAVTSAKLITDKYSGQSRGFGFVEMANDEEATAAISKLDGTDFDGRKLTVNEARPMEPRSGGFNGGRGDRGNRGGGGGRGGYDKRW
ncbi:MAG: RNA-binding protein [Elusimicrobia bacterium]|nr:RNA-binding protein [Elusimicrobiota bacterium]